MTAPRVREVLPEGFEILDPVWIAMPDGVKLDVEKATATGAAGTALAGKTLVVTGTLQRYKREEIESLIVQHGGHAASSVSKKTDFLIAGEKAGSKLEKAQSLGVRVINEAEFDELIAS